MAVTRRPTRQRTGVPAPPSPTPGRAEGARAPHYTRPLVRRTRSALIAIAVVAMLAAACSDDGSNVRSTPLPIHSGNGTPTGNAPEWPRGTFDASGADTVVKVKATEYAYEVTPPQAKGRKVFFEITNAGAEAHEFEVVLGEERVASIPTIAPGETKTLALEFPNGVYTLQCVVVKGVQ